MGFVLLHYFAAAVARQFLAINQLKFKNRRYFSHPYILGCVDIRTLFGGWPESDHELFSRSFGAFKTIGKQTFSHFLTRPSQSDNIYGHSLLIYEDLKKINSAIPNYIIFWHVAWVRVVGYFLTSSVSSFVQKKSIYMW